MLHQMNQTSVQWIPLAVKIPSLPTPVHLGSPAGVLRGTGRGNPSHFFTGTNPLCDCLQSLSFFLSAPHPRLLGAALGSTDALQQTPWGGQTPERGYSLWNPQHAEPTPESVHLVREKAFLPPPSCHVLSHCRERFRGWMWAEVPKSIMCWQACTPSKSDLQKVASAHVNSS